MTQTTISLNCNFVSLRILKLKSELLIFICFPSYYFIFWYWCGCVLIRRLLNLSYWLRFFNESKITNAADNDNYHNNQNNIFLTHMIKKFSTKIKIWFRPSVNLRRTGEPGTS